MMKNIGRYIVKGDLGHGGMGKVLHAHDPKYNRDVAIKILPVIIASDQSLRARFEQEAEICMALQHPAIVPVYDFGEYQDLPYLVMRYIEAGSLKQRLTRNREISLSKAVKWLEPVCEALEATHSQGIIHRDVKPSNILFDQYGYVYLSDFGIARLSGKQITLTHSNRMIGTPAYMSPEQILADKPVDHRCDVYALGIILFQMLTGTLPFESDTPSKTMLKHITDPVPSITSVNPVLPPQAEALISNALAKEANFRYQSVANFKNDLIALRDGTNRLKPIENQRYQPKEPGESVFPVKFDSGFNNDTIDLTRIDETFIQKIPNSSGHQFIDELLKQNALSQFNKGKQENRLEHIRAIREQEEASSRKRQAKLLGRDDTFYKKSYSDRNRSGLGLIRILTALIILITILVVYLYFFA